MRVGARWQWCAGVLSLLLAGAARAADGGDTGVTDLLYRLLNFALLGGVLIYFARTPVRDFFAARRASIETQLSEAAELQQRAEQQHARLEGQLAELDREREGIREVARERAEREAEQILADARAAAERIQRDAATAIEQELRRGQESLREEASELAVGLAAELLREQVGPEDRQRLLDEFIQSVEATPGPGLPGSGS
ncbi:MAG: ATP synthase F0 subunit B [Myxococcota bacterium]